MSQNKIEIAEELPHYEVEQDDAPIRPSTAGIAGLAASALDQAEKGIRRGFREAHRLTRVQVPQRAGNMAEVYHTASYNIDATAKGISARAQMTFDLPGGHWKRSPKDVLITTRKGTFSAQLKQTTSPSTATVVRSMADPKYSGVDIIVGPADIMPKARRYSEGRLKTPSKASSPKVTEQGHRQILEKGVDRMSVGGASSEPISSAEAIRMAEDPAALAKKLRGQAVKEGAKIAGAAAVIGGIAGAATSKEKTLKGKAKDALKSAGVAGGGAAASVLLAQGLKAAGQRVNLLRPLAKGNAATLMVDMGITILHQGYKYGKGDVTFAEVADACAEKGASIGGSVGGTVLASVGIGMVSAPGAVVLGTVIVGSTVGGYVAPKAYRATKKLLGKLFGAEEKPLSAVRRRPKPAI
ncbi:hypothetical protein HNP46_000532 [Pseudomonas nitritireducens]|uniref:Uncharacterized protein n=1 Tax=Pseudomonas nitroreducens TaxID=46680 RepID=A0A7W7KFW7_PSENT|nr:hypothetical protein [Pseudomonas nitritireducens]MBB4861721.1 hypothetical protein [Pseudomonas nitritireducens]